MKYFVFTLLQLLILSVAEAAIYRATIHSVDEGSGDEPYLIMFDDGHVGFMERPDASMVNSLQSNLETGKSVEVVLDEELNIVSMRPVDGISMVAPSDELESDEFVTHEGSVVSYDTSRRVFKSMRRDYQNQSQCYNRAHIWSYEEFQKSGIKTGKLFLFFTSRYIRNYRYHWWFHVTPMINVSGTGPANWRTLDRRYTSGPLKTRTWTNVFMLNNAYCPIVYQYSDYRYNQQKEDCYLIPTSMYFWQPRDIERQERTGYVKKQFFTSEVNHAYWEAF